MYILDVAEYDNIIETRYFPGSALSVTLRKEPIVFDPKFKYVANRERDKLTKETQSIF